MAPILDGYPNYDEVLGSKTQNVDYSYQDVSSVTNHVKQILQDFSQTLTTGPPRFDQDISNFGPGLDDAIDVVNGDADLNVQKSTEYIANGIKDFTTEQVLNDETTDFKNIFDEVTTKLPFMSGEHLLHKENDENMPYIILVVVLAILIVITIIALIIYHHKKKRNSKDITGVTIIGQSFNAKSSEEQQAGRSSHTKKSEQAIDEPETSKSSQKGKKSSKQ